ncbi:integrase [Rhodoligotrophos appendicifer]|uniref:tyrosine-type recombinase/integrase n=1 Tax=Rhodoligotrophos appendicifer TaxID=987056 RepID=UPI001186D218|nr:tyrosine-type recombinase/integrase [Rhodoligotrophos appendicifer]
MSHVRVKGFKTFWDRHGKRRCYHRASGIPVDLAKAPYGTAEFFAECVRIAAQLKKPDPPKLGTLGGLIAAYRAHDAFLDLSSRTQQDYHRCFNFLQPIGETPLIRFDSPLVVRIRDKASAKLGRRWGNYVKAVLSILFGWAAERGYMASNPAAIVKNIRRKKGAPEANRPWTDAEREAVLEAAPGHLLPAIALMMFCGLDPQDALALPRSAVQDGRIESRRGKTGQPVWLPLPAPVREILASAPAHEAETLCVTSRGQTWTPAGFRASWRPVRQKLEREGKVESGLTLKGLRHTVATILAEIGYDNRAIADVLGQKTEAMAAHYSRRADRSKKNAATMEGFAAEVTRRRGKTETEPS